MGHLFSKDTESCGDDSMGNESAMLDTDYDTNSPETNIQDIGPNVNTKLGHSKENEKEDRALLPANLELKQWQQDANTHSLTSELEQLDDEEKTLAIQFRSICTPDGKEKEETLKDSADLLLNLGKVYLQRANLQSGMEQKMSYIRCAVLVHAAIARFKIIKNPDKILLAKQVCHEINEKVLENCGARHQANLLEISEKIFERVCKKRSEIKKILNTDLSREGKKDPYFSDKNYVSKTIKTIENMKNLEKISVVRFEKLLSPPDKDQKEKRITEKVREVNKNVTSFYKEIMRNITSECIKFLPSPPCNFSIVGLGSVAREEATLYSDFEHIILLQEDIDKKEIYQSVLEYFRWFSVVFQVIVTGFGETIIPSVAVKSLNDSYSEDPGANWFHDNYTPNGISFDGMMPYACKIPIGRQEKTKNRPHTVELIKTPKQMAEYLTEKEQLKNGYLLDDVLRQTSLLYGDDETYISFMKERDRFLDRERTEIVLIYAKMILVNSVPYVRKAFEVTRVRNFNSKPYFYRPIAVNIAVLARMYDIEAESSFDILDTLHERRILGPTTYNKLMYTLAVACEVRMKLYHKENDRRHVVEESDIAKMVGAQTVWDCSIVLRTLQDVMASHLATEGVDKVLENFEKQFTKHNPSAVISDIIGRGYSENGLGICKKICQHTKQEKDEREITYTFIAMISYYLKCVEKCSNDQRRSEYFHEARALYSKLEKTEQFLGSSLSMRTDWEMACFCELMNMQQECILAFEKYFSKYFCSAQREDENYNFIMACIIYLENVRRNLSLEDANKKLETVLWDKSDKLDLKLLHRYHLAESALHNRPNNNNIANHHEITGISREFRSISSDIQKNGRRILFPMTLQTWILRVQIVIGCIEDAFETMNAASSFHATHSDLIHYNAEKDYLLNMKLMRLMLETVGVTRNEEREFNEKQLKDLWQKYWFVALTENIFSMSGGPTS